MRGIYSLCVSFLFYKNEGGNFVSPSITVRVAWLTVCGQQVRVLYSLELECQTGVNCPKKGPRTELWSSARKASAWSRPNIQVSAVLAIVILETNLLCGGEPVNTLARKWKKYMHILFIPIYNIFGAVIQNPSPVFVSERRTQISDFC